MAPCSNESTHVFTPLKFPCGVTACNRLAKAPMYEHLTGFFGGPPNEYHLVLYSIWSRHKWGMVITGNVQITPSHLTLGRDLVVPDELDEESLRPYKALANAIKGPNRHTLAIMQLSHAGRQSANVIGGRYPFKKPLAPSAIRVGAGVSQDDTIAVMVHNVLFQTPKQITPVDIDEIKEGFIRGARLAYQSGFDGVELHSAHGYLLAQFLSLKSNKREDGYSINSENGLRLLHQIIDGIRCSLPPRFIIGVKLNASDYLTGTPDNAHSQPETRALQHVADLGKWGTVDFIDISGGDYENPEFISAETSQKNRRQAFFARFSQQAIKVLESLEGHSSPRPIVMLTGGLRTPDLLQSALQSGQADILGIGRGSITCPRLPDVMSEYEQGRSLDGGNVPFGVEPDLSVPLFLEVWPLALIWRSLVKVKLVGAGFNVAWHTVMMRRLVFTELDRRAGVESHPLDYTTGGLSALIQMYMWVSNPREQSKRPTPQFGTLFVILGLWGGVAVALCVTLFSP